MAIKTNSDGTITDTSTGLVYTDQYSRVMGKPIPGRRETGDNSDMPNFQRWVDNAINRFKNKR